MARRDTSAEQAHARPAEATEADVATDGPVWHLYLVRSAGGTLYTGIATDVARRVAEHGEGRGAKSLRGRGPCELAFSVPLGDRSTAQRVEHRVKRLTRAEKEGLIRSVSDAPGLLDILGMIG